MKTLSQIKLLAAFAVAFGILGVGMYAVNTYTAERPSYVIYTVHWDHDMPTGVIYDDPGTRPVALTTQELLSVGGTPHSGGTWSTHVKYVPGHIYTLTARISGLQTILTITAGSHTHSTRGTFIGEVADAHMTAVW